MILGLFLVNDIQTPPPSPSLRNGHICMKDAEINKKLIFRFLVSEIWTFKILEIVWKMVNKIYVLEDAQCFDTDLYKLLKLYFKRCAIFSLWDVVDYVLKLRSELSEDLRGIQFFFITLSTCRPPPKKKNVFIFLSQTLRNVLKPMKNQYSDF